MWCAVCVMLWGALRCGVPCLLHYLSCFISHSIIMTFILTIFWATEMQLWLICLVCWLLALRTVQAQMWDDARWKWTRKLYICTSSTRHWRFFFSPNKHVRLIHSLKWRWKKCRYHLNEMKTDWCISINYINIWCILELDKCLFEALFSFDKLAFKTKKKSDKFVNSV